MCVRTTLPVQIATITNEFALEKQYWSETRNDKCPVCLSWL